MLVFFRKLRKSFIESGSARKYLLYAIGEIALVVIGILLALQINNWNEAKKFAENEAYTLNEILNNLNEDADQIKLVGDRRKQAKSATESLLKILVNFNNEKVDISTDVSAFLMFERYYPLNNAFEMMKSTGLKISNKSLRTEISRYYDFEQKKIGQSIYDIEEVIVRIFNSDNPIRSNFLRSQSGAGIKSNITFVDIYNKQFRDFLKEELIPFRDNNNATLDKATHFLDLNHKLINNIKKELNTRRLNQFITDQN
jgi:hypothetical protein